MEPVCLCAGDPVNYVDPKGTNLLMPGDGDDNGDYGYSELAPFFRSGGIIHGGGGGAGVDGCWIDSFSPFPKPACLGPYFPYLPEINDPGEGCDDVETLLPGSGAEYYTYGPANHRYGTENVIEIIEGVAALWSARNDDILIGIGDISLEGGGRTRRHASHTLGIDVDFRPLRQDHQGAPVTIFDAAYDRDLTSDLIGAF